MAIDKHYFVRALITVVRHEVRVDLRLHEDNRWKTDVSLQVLCWCICRGEAEGAGCPLVAMAGSESDPGLL